MQFLTFHTFSHSHLFHSSLKFSHHTVFFVIGQLICHLLAITNKQTFVQHITYPICLGIPNYQRGAKYIITEVKLFELFVILEMFFFYLCLATILILTQTLMVKKEASGLSTISSTTRK